MKEKEDLFEILNPYMQSASVKKEIKNNLKKKELINLILKLKPVYEEQQALIKLIEQQLHVLLNAINPPEIKAEEKVIRETYMNEKILRRSLDVLEKAKRIHREVLAIGEHYQVDIYKLLWKKRFIRQFYVVLSKKMKKAGYPDYKLNWDRINKLIKHQGKSIEKSTSDDISPKIIKKIKALVSETLIKDE